MENLIEMKVGEKTITYSLQELGNDLLDCAAGCLSELGRIMKNSDLYQEELQSINRIRTKLAQMTA
jgi:PP-loop superfamily ATP-utilizing enzyme